MISFKIDVSDEIQREIEQAIKEHIDGIEDGEPIAIINKGLVIVVQRVGNMIFVERIIEKVL
jgi:hypothetical protein